MCVCCNIDETTFYQNIIMVAITEPIAPGCGAAGYRIGVAVRSPVRLQQEAAPTDFNKNLSLMSNYQVGTSRRAWLAL